MKVFLCSNTTYSGCIYYTIALYLRCTVLKHCDFTLITSMESIYKYFDEKAQEVEIIQVVIGIKTSKRKRLLFENLKYKKFEGALIRSKNYFKELDIVDTITLPDEKIMEAFTVSPLDNFVLSGMKDWSKEKYMRLCWINKYGLIPINTK